MISFWPKLDAVEVSKAKNKDTSNHNLLFFGDIADYSGKEYAEEVGKRYFPNSTQKFSQYQEDLASEIVYNAKVTSRKYEFFKWAFYCDMLALALLILFLICA